MLVAVACEITSVELIILGVQCIGDVLGQLCLECLGQDDHCGLEEQVLNDFSTNRFKVVGAILIPTSRSVSFDGSQKPSESVSGSMRWWWQQGAWSANVPGPNRAVWTVCQKSERSLFTSMAWKTSQVIEL